MLKTWYQCLLVAGFLIAAITSAFGADAGLVNDVGRAKSAAFAPSLTVLQGAGPEVGVTEVANRLTQFEPLDSTRLYRVTPAAPLWLRAQLSSAEPLARDEWVLEFQSVVVDRYEVYQRDASGVWQVAVAGDRVAHTQWPLDSLRPQFALNLPQAGTHDVLIRVVHKMPSSFRPLILKRSAAQQSDSDHMLWTGLLLGVVFALILSCAQMSFAYRDLTYAWYAGYLLFTVMAALSYSGVAHRMLWPAADTFSSSAIVIGVMAAFAFNLQFSRSMFGALQGRAYHVVANALIGACMVYLVITVLTVKFAPLVQIFQALTASVFAFIIYSALSAWRKGVRFGGYWLMVYLPYLLGVAATLADSSGLYAMSWIPVESPIALAILEAVAMMLCINAYSRLRHAQAVQAQVAAQHDPLTGFLNAANFAAQAAKLWNNTPAGKRHIAVLHIQVEEAEIRPLMPLDAEALMARSVRVVRASTREFDAVGRTGSTRLGVVMADVPNGEALNARLQRMVALGLMRESTDPRNAPVRLRISVGQRHEFAGDFAALDAALRHLSQTEDANNRNIQHLGVVVPVTRVGEAPSLDMTQAAQSPV